MEVLSDRHVRLPSLLAGDGELLVERLGSRVGRRDPDHRERDPEQRDDALVGKDPTGYRGHGLPPRIVAKINDL